MQENTIHEEDDGTVFELVVKEGKNVVDISAAITMQMKFRRIRDYDGNDIENPTLVTKTAIHSTDGTDGKLRYIGESDFLPVNTSRGDWEKFAYVEIPGWSGHSRKSYFRVEPA